MKGLSEYLSEAMGEIYSEVGMSFRRIEAGLTDALREDKAQGTTEYAILVGVLVVIAIVAIIAFRDRVSELWSAISDGINGL